MWLYVPKTSYPSAPEPVVSTSASDLRLQTFAQSVTLNGKPSQPRIWLRRFKKDSWTMRLFGQTLQPSTAQLGVDRLIGSLAESRASLTAQPVSDLAPTTRVTYGPPHLKSFVTLSLQDYSLRTSQDSPSITSHESDLSYKQWVTELRKDFSRRRKLAHHTDASDSSSWPTPNAESHDKHLANAYQKGKVWYRPNGKKVQLDLDRAVSMWATHFRQDQPTPKPGHEHSLKCRSLNPLFAESLMGWPRGWSSLALDRIDSGLSATALFRWQRLMRSELLAIGGDIVSH